MIYNIVVSIEMMLMYQTIHRKSAKELTRITATNFYSRMISDFCDFGK